MHPIEVRSEGLAAEMVAPRVIRHNRIVYAIQFCNARERHGFEPFICGPVSLSPTSTVTFYGMRMSPPHTAIAAHPATMTACT